MNRWTTWLVRGLALSVLVLAGCAQERAPINRVQPNALDKSFFVGAKLNDDSDNPEFYARAFVIDGSAQQSDISVGLYSGTDRIKWEITEDALIARKSYQIAQGQDAHGVPGPNPVNGTIVAKYKILSHFDIKRAYNPQTGEQLNIVEENTTDRPWQERKYMRVDWSTNEVVDPMWTEMFFGKIFGSETVEPLTYTVNDPTSEDAPHFEQKDGYFDITNKYYISPEKTALWGMQLPTCVLIGLYTGTTTNDCNAQEATVRHSFWKVDPNHDFEPTENTKRKMDVIANFGGAGSSFEPAFQGGTTQCWDPQYGYTQACFHQYLNKLNLWEQSHQRIGSCEADSDCVGKGLPDGSKCMPNHTCSVACTSDVDKNADGTADQCAKSRTGYKGSDGAQCDTTMHECTIPVRDRQLAAQGYWLNKETPAELLDQLDKTGAPTSAMLGADGKPAASDAPYKVPEFRGSMEDVIKSWNQLITTAIAYGREVECRRTGEDGTVKDPKKARSDCHAKYFVTNGGNDVTQMIAFGGWGIPTPKVLDQDDPAALVACHAPVRDYDFQKVCGQVTAKTCDPSSTAKQCAAGLGCNPEGHCADVARNGDQRKNMIFYWPWDSAAHYGGVAGLGGDPETGEEHGVTATIMGRSATRAAAIYRDYLQTAMGDFSVDDVTAGVPQHVYNKIMANGYSPDSAMARKARGATVAYSNPGDGSSAGATPASAPQTSNSPSIPAGGVTGTSQSAQQLSQRDNLIRLAQDRANSTLNVTLQNTAQLKWDALASQLRGTPIEADLVDPHWAMATIGADPRQALTSEELADASPLRNLDPGKLALWRAKIAGVLADRGICYTNDVTRIGSVNFQGLARYYEDKFHDMGLDTDVKTKDSTGLWLAGPRDPALVKKRGDFMYKDMFHGMATGIAIHEVGHTLGMRHNFASSYDSPNYMPQYWQLRTEEGKASKLCQDSSGNWVSRDPAKPDTCMGPRFADPQSLDEEGLAPPTNGQSNGRPGVGYFGNSTVMEYEQDYMSPGIAPYDFMYVKAVYANILETYDIDNVSKGGVAESNQGNFVANLAADRAEWSLESDNFAHYTHLANDLHVFQESYCRPATKDELKQGQWRIVHGKICTQSPRDHFMWKDFYDDANDGPAPPTTLAQFGWTFTDWRTNPKMPHADGHDHERWSYRYGETYGTGYLHTNYLDNGADPYEVTINNSQMYDMTYPRTYFRSQYKNYMFNNIPSRTAERYFERARAFHWILEGSGNMGEDTQIYQRADRETFYFLARAAMSPEPGPMVAGTALDGSTMYDVSSGGGGLSVQPSFDIGLIDGRYVGEDYSDSDGGQWDYLHWINHAGFGLERGLAIRSLLDGRPTLYTISRETFLDGRNVMKNFRTDDALGLDRYIGGILSEDWANVAPWVKDNVGTAPDGLPYRSPQMLNLLDQNVTRPAGAQVVFPNIGYKTEVQTVVWGMLYAAMDSNLTLMRKMAIYIKGIDEVDAIPANELVSFTDPDTGLTYLARKFGSDTINGNTVDSGIASRMLQHANMLLTSPYAAADGSDLRKYVGLLDTAHEAERLLAPYSGWRAIGVAFN